MTSTTDSIRPSTLAYAVGREPVCPIEASVSVHAIVLAAIEGLDQLSHRPDLIPHSTVLEEVREVLKALAQVMANRSGVRGSSWDIATRRAARRSARAGVPSPSDGETERGRDTRRHHTGVLSVSPVATELAACVREIAKGVHRERRTHALGVAKANVTAPLTDFFIADRREDADGFAPGNVGNVGHRPLNHRA
jgi:hypothetical protein